MLRSWSQDSRLTATISLTVVDVIQDTVWGIQCWTPESSLTTKYLLVALAVTVGRTAAGPDLRTSLRSGTQVFTGKKIWSCRRCRGRGRCCRWFQDGDAYFLKLLIKGDGGNCMPNSLWYHVRYEHPALIVKDEDFIVTSVIPILITATWNTKISTLRPLCPLCSLLTCQIYQVIKSAGSGTEQFIRESRHFSPVGGDTHFIYLSGAEIIYTAIIRHPPDYKEYKVVLLIIIAGTGVLPSSRD